MGRLIVISNRVHVPTDGPAAGGLAVAVDAALKGKQGVWMGWSGKIAANENINPTVFSTFENITYALCDLTKNDVKEYYEGFSNGVLWPLCHYRLGLMRYARAEADSYYRVNEFFAKRIVEFINPDDILWVHDYHFLPLAHELRKLGVRNKIGFFLHIPWPSYDIFSALPLGRKLLSNMLEYTKIGFQTERDKANFDDAILHEGLVKAEPRYEDKTQVFPIGIDALQFKSLAKKSVRTKQVNAIGDSLRDRELIIGVDRLDYSKGLLHKFDGFQSFLDHNPKYVGHATLLQITPKSRDRVKTYLNLGRDVARRAGQINGEMATIDWTPIRYVNRPYSHEMLAGLFRISRAGLVTPLRDGMNLVAKEYVAAQDKDDPGVLILSKFAGAASELTAALIVNPYDADEMGRALKTALSMPLNERIDRYNEMMKCITENSIKKWGEDFVGALHSA